MKTGATYTRDSVKYRCKYLCVAFKQNIHCVKMETKTKSNKAAEKYTKINLNKIEMGFLVRYRCSALIHSEHFVHC